MQQEILSLEQIKFVLFGAFVCGSGIVIYGQDKNLFAMIAVLVIMIFIARGIFPKQKINKRNHPKEIR